MATSRHEPATISGGIRLTAFDRVFKPKTVTLPSGATVTRRASRVPLAALFILALSVFSIQVTKFNPTVLAARGSAFFDILRAMVPPNWSYMGDVWEPLFDTIKMSLLGSFIGSVLVIPFAVAASTNIVHGRVVVAIMRLLLSIIRTLPTIVTALVATYVFGLGTLAGTTAIAVFTFAYVGKILYEEIEVVDMGSYEAMEAMGAGRVRSFRWAILPQIAPSYLSNCLYCFEGNVRYASILGYVGAGGLGLLLNERLGWRMYPDVGMVLVALFVTVFCIETISRAARKRLS